MQRLGIILLFFLYCFYANAQINVKLHGLSSFNIKTDKVTKDSSTAYSLANQVLMDLRKESYLAATIDSIVSGDTLHFYYKPNKVYKWAKLKRGNLPEELVQKVDLSGRLFLNRPFNPKQLELLFKRIIQYYENNGYPFASVQLDSLELEENLIKASLLINQNQYYSIDSILVLGDGKAHDNYLRRHLGLKENEPYQEEKITAISNRIREIPFLELSKEPEVQYYEKGVKIILNTKKKRASRFDGVLGLLSDETTGNIELTGDVDLNLINPFNRGENIGLNWRKLKGNSQDLKILMRYPYFLNSPFGLEFDFKLFKRDSSFIDLQTRIGFNYNLRRAEFIRMFYSNKSSNLLSRKSLITNSNGQLPLLGDIRINAFGVGYQISRLDYQFNPRKGIELNGDFSVGLKRLLKIAALEEENPGIYENVKTQTTQYDGKLIVNTFIPIKNRSTIKLGNQSASTFSERLYFNELLRIGGLKTLRGVDEESINVSTYSIFTLEYRFLLDRNSFFSLFADGAYYEAEYLENYIKDTPYGIGAGVSFETAAGIFTINYAVGKQFDNPVDIRAAKVHFGFINFF